MKKGQKVVCVIPYKDLFTYGKIYDVIFITTKHLIIKSDKENISPYWVKKEVFISLKEYRKKKLNKILKYV